MAIWAMRIEQNPNDVNQYYVMWGNGRIEPGGLNPPPALDQTSWDEPANIQPQAGKAVIVSKATDPVFWAFKITDWTTFSGYQLSTWGNVFNFGPAAPDVGLNQPVFSFYPFYGMVDMSLDPANPGTGYAMDFNGMLYPIGALSVPPGSSGQGTGLAIRLLMDWPSKRWVIVDWYGRRYSNNGAVSLVTTSPFGTFQPSQILATRQVHNNIKVYDGLGVGAGHGWMVSHFGYTYALNSSEAFNGVPIKDPWQWYYMDFAILDDGTGVNPVKLRVLNGYGGVEVYNNATVPTVSVSAPVDPTTDTTRPTVIWQYGQGEGNLQDSVTVRVFTAAQYGIGGFDPTVSPSTWDFSATGEAARTVRSATIGVDLANTTYRAYVWVKSTAGLANVGNVFGQWVQNTTPPATPAVTITPGGALDPTTIHCSATITTGGLFYVEYNDGDGIWRYVTGGAGATPIGSAPGVADVFDYKIPYGAERFYRARQVVPNPYLAGLYAATAAVTVNSSAWTLQDAATNTTVQVSIREFDRTRKVIAKDFWPDGRKTAVVLSGSVPIKGIATTLKVRTLDQATFDALEAIVTPGNVLMLRDFFGDSWYLAVTGDMKYTLVAAQSARGEITPIRHFHEVDIPVTEVSRPLEGPDVGPLALTGGS